MDMHSQVPSNDLNWMQTYAASEMVELQGEGRIDRREMLTRLVAICGSVATAQAFIVSCTSTPSNSSNSSASSGSSGSSGTDAAASTDTTASAAAPATVAIATVKPPTNGPAGRVLSVSPDDPDVRGAEVTFAGPAGSLFGYLATPTVAGDRPGILVIHEIFGLTDHIRDVARRLAKVGYVALSVDLASRAGGSAKAENVMTALTGGPVADRLADLDAARAFLRTQPGFNNKLGVTGFCFGGGMTLSYAAFQPDVLAAVPYYGPTPQPASDMAKTNAAILAHYGETDARVNAGIPDLEAAMVGKTFEKRVHAGAGHAFNNDTGGAYNETVAVDAWSQTLTWFDRHLT